MRRPQGCSTDGVPPGAVRYPTREDDIKGKERGGTNGECRGRDLYVNCDVGASGLYMNKPYYETNVVDKREHNN